MASASQTSLILRRELPLRGFDLDVRGALAEQLARARPGPAPRDASVSAIARSGDGVLLDTSAGPLEDDAVLYATGRDPVPNTASLGLDELGVDARRRTARSASTGATAAASPSIYAIGDCSDHAGSGLDAGSFDLTPVAIAEGRAIAETLFNDNPQEVSYDDDPDRGVQPARGGGRRPDRGARARRGPRRR